MNIGFDLDKIFIDYPPFIPDIFINRLYKQRSNGVLSYRIPKRPEQQLRIFTHHPLLRPPIIENLRFAESLSKTNNHKQYLISSRFSFLKDQTEFIVKKYNFHKIFDAMFFNFKDQQPHIFKDQVVKKMKIDRYVDDDLPLLEYLTARNPKVKFFWLNKKEQKDLAKNLFGIRQLSEMFTSNVHLRGVPKNQHHLGGGEARYQTVPGEAATSTPPR